MVRVSVSMALLTVLRAVKAAWTLAILKHKPKCMYTTYHLISSTLSHPINEWSLQNGHNFDKGNEFGDQHTIIPCSISLYTFYVNYLVLDNCAFCHRGTASISFLFPGQAPKYLLNHHRRLVPLPPVYPPKRAWTVQKTFPSIITPLISPIIPAKSY